jgi:uncharacterized protein (DUF4213/DUF364 family)
LDGILEQLSPECLRVLLGPSTPISDKLLEHGMEVLFGVQVVDMGAAIESIVGGHNFQKLNGLRRVSLFNPRLTG